MGGDLASSVQSLFSSASSLKSIKPQCDADDNCAQNSLGVISALTSFGGGAAASYNDCDAAAHPGFTAFNKNGGGSAQAGCASDVMNSVAAISKVANAAITMSKKCEPTATKLYEQRTVGLTSRLQTNGISMVMLPVGGFLILAAGFFGGMRYGVKWQQKSSRDYLNVEKMRVEEEPTPEVRRLVQQL